MQTMLPESGYSLHSAAKIIGCHPKHIYKIVERGELQPFLGLDGRLMLTREELYAYLKQKEASVK